MLTSLFPNGLFTRRQPQDTPNPKRHVVPELLNHHGNALFEALEKSNSPALPALFATYSKRDDDQRRTGPIDLEYRGYGGDTLLLRTVKAGDYPNAVRKLLNGGAKAEAKDKTGKTAFAIAAEKHRNKTLGMLLDHSDQALKNEMADFPYGPMLKHVLDGEDLADPPVRQMDLTDQDGASPLLHAVRNDNRYGTYLLTEHQARANAQDKDGNTALMEATRRGDLYSGLRVMRLNPDAKPVDQTGKTALIHWIQNAPASTWYRQLGSVILRRLRTGNLEAPPLFDFTTRLANRSETVTSLQDQEGRNALSYLAEAPNRNTLWGYWAYMMVNGRAQSEDYDAVDNEGKTALMRFVLNQPTHFDAIAPLNYLPAIMANNINVQDKDGKTALIHAAERGNLQAMAGLLTFNSNMPLLPPLDVFISDTQIDTRLKDANGDTVLTHLSRLSPDRYQLPLRSQVGLKIAGFFRKEVNQVLPQEHHILKYLTQRLLKEGANPDDTNSQGETALMIAAQTGNLPVLMPLVEAFTEENHEGNHGNAGLNRRNKAGQSALSLVAVLNRHWKAAVSLLLAGADPLQKDFQGKSTLDLAAESEDKEMFEAFKVIAEGQTELREALIRAGLPVEALLQD